MVTATAIESLSHDSMLRVYLQSTHAVDKRMKTAETTASIGKGRDEKAEDGKRKDRDVAEVDKSMASLTDSVLVQEARRFMEGMQPCFTSSSSTLF